jgi:exosortase/archaeosortase family protein
LDVGSLDGVFQIGIPMQVVAQSFTISDKPHGTPSLNKLVFCLLCVAFPNGLYLRISQSIAESGLDAALLGTFNISAVILIALWLCLQVAQTTDFDAPRMLDYAAIAIAYIFALAPVSALAWVGLTGLSLYFLVTRPGNPSIQRTFWLLLAICFSCLWSRQVFRLFVDHILQFDTLLVATFSGRPWSDNLIKAADGVTTLQVLESCSSFSNMSLAFLGWISARSYYGTRGLRRSMLFIALSCTLVVLINTIRIGLIALRPDQYDLIHGAVGAGIASVISAVSIAAVSIWGARA